ncbi:hypothetical protein A9K55_003704 [Cordyceps militaris]|uniref:Uncharacterized protein n=1 Tax=Cordyceps militaris TaxID=73501 RepID=A0A2H4S6L7_CORMI|nr:hypothetical protein A9K55_003704 [Cordyceps militaris]
MALTIKQLHGAASFLITLEPLDTSDIALSTPSLSILLDPQTTTTTGVLPTIDLVLISSARRRHCHEATLRQLPSHTRILAAVPAAARRIRGWRHFDPAVVECLPRWDDDDDDRVLRIPVLAARGGVPGEVTLTAIRRKRGGAAHAAIGITYRPPTATRPWLWCAAPGDTLVPPPPPGLPTPALSFSSSGGSSPVSSTSAHPSPPLAPRTPPPPPPPSITSPRRRRPVHHPPSPDRGGAGGVSILFAPRGVPYRGVQGYAATHLLNEAVLPLTALLHCFDAPSTVWPRGGSGRETASALGARAWIGVGPGHVDAVQRALDESFARGMASPGNMLRRSAGLHPTEVRALAAGDELSLTSEGVWDEETLFSDEGKAPRVMLGLGLDMDRDEERLLSGALGVDWVDALR